MTDEQWKRLDELFSMKQTQLTAQDKVETEKLFKLTMEVGEHPEDWDSPCLCRECRSVA